MPRPEGPHTAIPQAVQYEVPHCPLCSAGPELWALYSHEQAEGFELLYQFCRRCGLVFQSPRPSTDDLMDFYRDQYHERAHSEVDSLGKEEWVQTQRSSHVAGTLRGIRAGFSNHLDIGCSSGALLARVQEEFGADSYGIEPNEVDRELVEARGYPCVSTMDEIPETWPKSFDLVTMCHVLEHLAEPIAMLRDLRARWLDPSGLLLVEVPNLYGHSSLEAGHLFAFSPHSMQAMLRRAGLRIVRFKIHGHPYSRLLPLFCLAVAVGAPRSDPALSSAPPLSWSRFRRWLGMSFLQLARWLGKVLLRESARRPWGSEENQGDG